MRLLLATLSDPDEAAEKPMAGIEDKVVAITGAASGIFAEECSVLPSTQLLRREAHTSRRSEIRCRS